MKSYHKIIMLMYIYGDIFKEIFWVRKHLKYSNFTSNPLLIRYWQVYYLKKTFNTLMLVIKKDSGFYHLQIKKPFLLSQYSVLSL